MPRRIRLAAAARLSAVVLGAILGRLPGAQAAPARVANAAGDYVGRDHNVGQMQCEETVFVLQDGALIGHYHLDADPPLDGTLTDFAATGEREARFTWRDRDGTGVRVIRFAADFGSFFSQWGRAAPDPRLTGYGLRQPGAAVPGCTEGPVS